MMQKLIIAMACGCCLAAPAMVSATLVVTQPTASTVVAAGDDYATQVLGNAWDMSDAVDIDTEESFGVANQMIGSGIFSGDTTGNGANFYPVFMGYASAVNLSRGANFPIDTSHYRYVTYKLRVNQASQPQFTRVLGIVDGGSYGATPKPTVVESQYTAQLPNNVWIIVSFDMVTNNDNLFFHWTDFPQLTGLRIDPATTNVGGTYASAHVDIDWIRLTAPATPAQKTAVQWTDSGSATTYTLTAIDAGGTGVRYTLATGVSGTSFQADTSFLAPGQYTIEVKRADTTAAPSGVFTINSPAQVTITAPSVRGEQALDFATNFAGNPWGPMDPADFSIIDNFTNVSYTNPAGSFYGRPTNFDPGWFLNLHGQTIDTSVYRSLCFKQEVFGPRSVASGSIARLFWGNANNALTTSKDIVLDDNLGDTVVGEYCIPDLAAAPLEPGPSGGTWSGTKSVFRLDPDELVPPSGCSTADTCHDVRLDSVTLSPFAEANPDYLVQWTLAPDPDFSGGGSTQIFLDPDKTFGNGNEIRVAVLPYTIGANQFKFVAGKNMTNGTYNLAIQADDGVNIVTQYAGGPIIVRNDDVIFRDGFDPPP